MVVDIGGCGAVGASSRAAERPGFFAQRGGDDGAVEGFQDGDAGAYETGVDFDDTVLFFRSQLCFGEEIGIFDGHLFRRERENE